VKIAITPVVGSEPDKGGATHKRGDEESKASLDTLLLPKKKRGGVIPIRENWTQDLPFS